MNYDPIYDRLIERARGRELVGYSEKHHIQPKCVGGNDDVVNIVRLTPEEHYLAHQLLIKMIRYRSDPDYYKLIFAANMMSVGRNNKKYAWLKKRFSSLSSEMNTGRKQSEETIANRVTKNTGQTRSDETKRKISESKIGKKRDPFSAEWRQRLSKSGSDNGMFGKTHSDDAKQKVSQANKGRVLSEERKLIISQQQTGLRDSPETKAKKSAAMKRRWEEKRRIDGELKK
jgi:hypothetical protein